MTRVHFDSGYSGRSRVAHVRSIQSGSATDARGRQASHQYMRVLNGRKHYPLWDVNGRTNTAENPIWWQYLPLDERGVLVIDSDVAVRPATLHNTNYQGEVETLYLSALDVSTERFLLGNQLVGGFSRFFTADGICRARTVVKVERQLHPRGTCAIFRCSVSSRRVRI